MKIGIVGSGSDMLVLRKILQKYDYDYCLYYDDLLWPYGDKPNQLVHAIIADAIEVLCQKGCTHIILPPIWEVVFRKHKHIVPLFRYYLHDYCFRHSLVGKIGLVGDWSDICIAQDTISSLATEYTLSDQQKNTKKFHFPFAWRTKEVQLRKYFLTTLSYSNPMVNTIIKFDLRYFKDAGIDTLIPLNYGYFQYQKVITKFLHYNTCRFHSLDCLQQSFDKALAPSQRVHNEQGSYSVHILYTGQKELLARQKKIMRLLERGKNIVATWEKI